MKIIKNPINQFIKLETAGSIILFGATACALIIANSFWGHDFLNFWKNYISFSFPGFTLSKPILKWINDGLMVIFFFLIGLEIKREILTGELNSLKKAFLPLFAALGGMIAPAIMFSLINKGNAGSEGWGIPMAADIAFTLGILKLLGKRAPYGLKIFLMAFAIIDDLGAVLVIAFFYSQDILWINIIVSLVLISLMAIASSKGYYSKYLFFLLGLVVWILFLKSGIHTTIAGVLLALTIPVKRKTDTKSFYNEGQKIMNNFLTDCKSQQEKTILSKEQMKSIDQLEELTEKTASPLQYLEHKLHGWVSFLIMPLFALANAGVIFTNTGTLNTALALNIALSMIIGNFSGIFLFSWLSIRLKISALPEGVTFSHLAGISVLGGLGFTMSLFINSLAYSDPVLINSAKMGILCGSFIAGILGYTIIRLLKQK